MKTIAVTMGDPAGIGPEIIARAFRDAPEVMSGCVVAGDVATMRRAAGFVAAAGQDGLARTAAPVVLLTSSAESTSNMPGCLPVLQVGDLAVAVAVGKIDRVAGKMAGDCVLWAVRAALRGEVAALVTAPLHKEALSAAGEPYSHFPGHTEMLQFEAAAHMGKPVSKVPVRMMLANDELRVVLVSIHLGLRDAICAVTFDNVLETLRIAHTSLQRMLGRVPRLGVAGLNPHAGEGGLFGREEIDVIEPAVRAARAEGLDVHGPFAPDTVFMRGRSAAGKHGEFDAVIAMYHDQGLIPVKYLGVEKGVNVTLGLPIVRTSPDHGTAFDIAGQGIADASSLIEAVRMARRLIS
jgi:4-hydroxythreonine-4-phosphate dehydrogenase